MSVDPGQFEKQAANPLVRSLIGAISKHLSKPVYRNVGAGALNATAWSAGINGLNTGDPTPFKAEYNALVNDKNPIPMLGTLSVGGGMTGAMYKRQQVLGHDKLIAKARENLANAPKGQKALARAELNKLVADAPSNMAKTTAAWSPVAAGFALPVGKEVAVSALTNLKLNERKLNNEIAAQESGAPNNQPGQSVPTQSGSTSNSIHVNLPGNMKFDINSNALNWILGVAGAGALGLGGLAVYKYLTSRDKANGAKIQYRMQGKKGDPWSEALVDVPIHTPKLSPKVKDTLESSLKRQVSKNIKYMSTKRDPNTGKRIAYEDWMRLYGDDVENESKEKTPNDDYKKKLDNKYEKAASVKEAANREWAEGSGTIANTLASVLLGAAAGHEFANQTGKDSLYGALAGGAAGLAPTILGSLFGHMAGERTPSAQLKHDDRGASLEFLVPGYGAYNSARRNPRAIQLLTPALQEAYQGEDEEDDFDDDDDFDKDASAAPAPPAPQASNTQPPAPVQKKPGDMATASVHNPATPIAEGQTAKQLPMNAGASQALNAINALRGHYGIAPTIQEQQKQQDL